MEMKAFEEPLEIKGKTYYDTPSRNFSIIRLPATAMNLFPKLKKSKTEYKIVYFPDKKSLLEYLMNNETLPMLLSFIRKD